MSRRRIRWATTLGSILVASAGLAVWVPATAEAGTLPTVTGVVKVEAASLNNSNVSKTAKVTCPDGKRLINAGGYIVGGNGLVGMDDVYPDLTTNSVQVTGKETDPLSTNWWVSAVATCADEPSGLELVWTPSAAGSAFMMVATARCPGTKTVLGSGATIEGGQGEVILDTITPNGGLGAPATEVATEAFETGTFTGDWTLNAFAICADPLSGQQMVEDETVSGSANNGARAQCAAGQVETGTGAEQVGVYGVVNIASEYPIDGSATTAPTATTVYGEEIAATTGTWSIKAFALCADA